MTGSFGSIKRPLALIVGCGGLGLACAERFGRDHRLFLVDIDGALAQATSDRLCADGYSASWSPCDVTSPAAVQALGARLAGEGGVAALVHVAGLAPSCGDSSAILRVNAVGPALVAKTCLPLMSAGGAAVMFSSLGGHIVPADPSVIAALDEPLAVDFLDRVEAAAGASLNPSTAYAWSKIALMRLCRRAASEWALAGVRINSISPGLIASPMGEREFLAEPRKQALLARIPLARQGTMAEIAEVAAFLCSASASYISGTDLLVDGGLAAALAQN